MPKKLLATLTIPFALALSACANQPRVQIVQPPANLTSCADEPLAPDLPEVDWSSLSHAYPLQMIRDRAVVDYILAMRAAWGDCHSKVEGVAAWRDGLG